MNFLTDQFHTGIGLGSLRITRSALNSVIELPGYPDISEHPLIKRFFKGAFNLRPPPPAKKYTWDINTLTRHMHNMPQNCELTLQGLTHKLVALFMILATSRVHYIHQFSIDHMDLQDGICIFYPTRLLKHSRPSFPGNPITYRHFPEDSQLCVISCLREYLSRREQLAPPHIKQLLITHRKPHHAAHRDTVARWLKHILRDAGIDTTRFTAHTFRAASSSHLKEQGISTSQILQHGQWTRDIYNIPKILFERN